MAAAIAVRPLVTLNVPKKVKSIISLAESIANSMNNNPTFPTPPLPIATLLADVAALNTAETAVLQRTKGAVEVRNAKLVVVRNDLEALRGYVQIVAATGTPANAPAVMEAAGMTIRKVTTHNKPALAAKAGTVSGTVLSLREGCGSYGCVRLAVLDGSEDVDDAPDDPSGQDRGHVVHQRYDVLLPGAGAHSYGRRELESDRLAVGPVVGSSARRASRGTPRCSDFFPGDASFASRERNLSTCVAAILSRHRDFVPRGRDQNPRVAEFR
jgi:hypothetical protein